jgi:hypothetical protein
MRRQTGTCVMIEIKSDDYIIVNHRGRNKLCLAMGNKTTAVIEKSLMTDEPENIQYKPEDVVCNLGPDPRQGSYLGVKVNPYQRTVETKQFGPIHLFCKVPKEDMTALKKAMKAVHSKFSKEASVSFLPLNAINLYPKKGKYAGSYTATAKGGEIKDSIALHPESYSDAIYNEYLVAHEFAHGFFIRCVPMKIRSKWMALYQKRLKLSSIKKDKLNQLLEDVIASDDGFSAYAKQIESEEDRLILKEVVGYYKRNHRMTPRDIDLMLAYDSSSMASLWPTSAKLVNERPDISTYSLKNVDEFFAESIAYYFAGKMVPKDVLKAIEFTFKKCNR